MSHNQHHNEEASARHKHKDEARLNHMARALDRISNVVTADLIVDFGVLCTGAILVFLELGLVPHRPLEDNHGNPSQETVVRRVDEGQEPSGH